MRRDLVLALVLAAPGCTSGGQGRAAVPSKPVPRPPTPVSAPASSPTSASDPAPTPKPPPPIEPVVAVPGGPTADPKQLIVAPAKYEHVFIRAALPVGTRYANLRYEGNNKSFRGPADDAGLYRSGAATAADWREYTAGVKGMVVLRDSLFSQQDHPYLQTPHALMMPPAWVSVAVAAVQAGRTPQGLFSTEVEDNAAWVAIPNVRAMFGDFPASDSLFTHATRSTDGAAKSDAAKTLNARRSIRALEATVRAMIEVAPYGADLVAKAGAAEIAASDRAYFGAELRKRALIPIFVENPNEHEARDEGKGMGVWGRDLPQAAIDLARHQVYARRLLDGDIALERYDLREASEQERARTLLESLVPAGSAGHVVWLWVNGGSDGHGNGSPATPYIEDFRRRLDAAPIEMTRVRLLSKPSVRPWGDEAASILATETKRYGDLGIPLSLQISTRNFRKLVGGTPSAAP